MAAPGRQPLAYIPVPLLLRPLYSVDQDVRYYRHLDMVLPSRSQLIRDSALTKTDLLEIATCRGEP